MSNDQNTERKGNPETLEPQGGVNSYLCPKHQIRVYQGDQCPRCEEEQRQLEKVR